MSGRKETAPARRGRAGAVGGCVVALGSALHVFNTASESEFDEAFATMSRLKVGALLPSTDPSFGLGGRGLQITMAYATGFHDLQRSGGRRCWRSCQLRPDLSDTWRQAGVYVGRILEGEKPSDLLIVQSTKFELVGILRRRKSSASTSHPRFLPAPTKYRIRYCLPQRMKLLLALSGHWLLSNVSCPPRAAVSPIHCCGMSAVGPEADFPRKSALDPGCVKTPAPNLRVELPSRFRRCRSRLYW
jgi:hypothetical protein